MIRIVSFALAAGLAAATCPSNDADKSDCGYAGIDQVCCSGYLLIYSVSLIVDTVFLSERL